jgi:hypothetical protein
MGMTKGTRFAIALAAVAVFAPSAGAEEEQAPAKPAYPMLEAMRENDKKLDELAATMNAAKGDAKVDAIAALLNELLAQRKALRQQMNVGHGMMRRPRAKRPEAKPTEPKPAE